MSERDQHGHTTDPGRIALEKQQYDRLYKPNRIAGLIFRAAADLIASHGWLAFKTPTPTDAIEMDGLGSWYYFDLKQSPEARRRASHFTLRGAIHTAYAEFESKEEDLVALARATDLVNMALACQLSIELGIEVANYDDGIGWREAAEDWNNTVGRAEQQVIQLLTRAATSVER